VAGFDRDQPARHADATGVGGGVKVVEKWRFEIPEKSWHGFRSGRRFNHVFWRCQVAVEGLRRKGRRKKGFYEPWEENAKHRAGISNRQNSTTFDLTATTGGPSGAAYLPGGGQARAGGGRHCPNRMRHLTHGKAPAQGFKSIQMVVKLPYGEVRETEFV
jgi:hypothetical protein